MRSPLMSEPGVEAEGEMRAPAMGGGWYPRKGSVLHGLWRSMRPKQQAMIISLNDGVWLRAQVVYCQRATENRFAVGLELSASVESWASPY